MVTASFHDTVIRVAGCYSERLLYWKVIVIGCYSDRFL